MGSTNHKAGAMRFNRNSLNIFSFQTLAIASVVGSRAGSWDVILLTAVVVVIAWSRLSQLSDMALYYTAMTMGCL